MPTFGTVVIVTYNAATFIGKCLESLHEDHKAERIKVIVVDNCSEDSTVDIIAGNYSWVKLIRSAVNGGFGAGNNLGIKQAKGEFCFFLNPDSSVKPGCIDKLWEYLRENQDTGCVGPLIVDNSGVPVLSYFAFNGLFISIWTAVGLQKLLPVNHSRRRWEVRRKPATIPVEVDRIVGAAMMMRMKSLKDAGGFDERFFLYSEEEDLCLRLKKARWKVVFCPEAVVEHHGGGSTGSSDPIAIAAADWSRYIFMRKHYPRLSSELSRFLWISMLSARLIVFTIIESITGRKLRAAGILQSIKSLLKPGYFDRELRPPR